CVRLEVAHLAPVGEHPEPDTVALLRRGVPQHHVRDVNRRFHVDDAAGDAACRIRPLMPLHDVHVLDDDAVVREHAQHDASPALVAARDHDDLVTLPDTLHVRLYSTSGASEMIFMNRLVRSSRVTGPKMRVPIGSSRLLSNTAALLSNRIAEPSGRRSPCFVRTTTAL